jgi:hypothetical protein
VIPVILSVTSSVWACSWLVGRYSMPLAASITSKVSLTQFQPSWVTGVSYSRFMYYLPLICTVLHCLCTTIVVPQIRTQEQTRPFLYTFSSLWLALYSLFVSPGHGLKSKPGHFSIRHLLSGWHSPLFFVAPGHGLEIISNREMGKGI